MGVTQLSQLKRIFFDFSSIVLAYCLNLIRFKEFSLYRSSCKYTLKVQYQSYSRGVAGGGGGVSLSYFHKNVRNVL